MSLRKETAKATTGHQLVHYGAAVAQSPVTPPSHLPIAMAVRPARLGLLVPTRVDEIAWLKLFEAALAAQARVWGASGNLIFPLTADVAERELFWELADRFDADAFVTYAPEWTEMRELAPGRHTAREEGDCHDRRASLISRPMRSTTLSKTQTVTSRST